MLSNKAAVVTLLLIIGFLATSLGQKDTKTSSGTATTAGTLTIKYISNNVTSFW